MSPKNYEKISQLDFGKKIAVMIAESVLRSSHTQTSILIYIGCVRDLVYLLALLRYLIISLCHWGRSLLHFWHNFWNLNFSPRLLGVHLIAEPPHGSNKKKVFGQWGMRTRDDRLRRAVTASHFQRCHNPLQCPLLY